MRLTNQSNLWKSLQSLISYLLLLATIGISLLSLVSNLGGNIFLELLSHFKLQYLLISLLLFVFIAATRKRLFILIALFCIAINLTYILSWYIPIAGVRDAQAGNLRVLSSNVNVRNNSYSKTISFLRKERPDIAVIMEVNDEWIKQLESLNDILPYSIGKVNPSISGMAVYSKLPFENTAVNFFGTSKNPTILVDLKLNGQIISLIGTHPPPPFKPILFQYRNKQLTEISQYIQQLKTPVVMVGDLNTTMWSSYYKRFVNQTGLRNARKGFGILPSWPMKTTYPHYSKIPPFMSWLLSIPIDHCLISPKIKVSNIRTGTNVNSDHLPLIIDLVIPKEK